MILVVICLGCGSQLQYDLVLYNADIHTVDTTLSTAGSIAIVDGKIAALFEDRYPVDTMLAKDHIDLQGAFVIPGLIEGHGHFSGLGYSKVNLNLLDVTTWQEVVDRVADRAAKLPPGTWIEGRGWHQDKLTDTPIDNVLGYPKHYTLSEVSPDHPAILTHASGHSLYANAAAMTASNVSPETGDPAGGLIVRDNDGIAIGVFEERAMQIVRAAHRAYKDSLPQAELEAQWYAAIDSAQVECLRKGLTSFQDAGSKMIELDRYRQMARQGNLDLRLWAMIRHSYDEMDGKLGNYKVRDVGNRFYTCDAIKSEVDGALGAYGAWLLEPYADKTGWMGQNTTDIYEVRQIADLAVEHDMQMCVHAIGDRANRVVVDIYEGMIKQMPAGTDHRWRIEHAQHLDTTDIPRFASNNIIASMQGIHCTSDALFVERRLGESRAKNGAYAWRRLLDAGITIANGTDAPVEDVDPLQSIYASVTRKRTDGSVTFYPEQAMTRTEAIHSYTLGNAYAAKEDDYKGSLTVGKVADITVLDHNLLTCSDDDILNTSVLYTIVDGKIKYQR
jgi:predicted amidohydrolase YtcJ